MSDFKMFFRILSDSKVTYTRVSGDLLLTEMLKELHKLIQHPSFNPNTNYFHDFREVDKIVGSLPEHERLADFAISVASDEALNVIFVIQDNNPSVQSTWRDTR